VFGWLQARCPIDPGAKRWTEDRIGWLLGQFGRERLKNASMVVPARQFFPDRYDNSERAARALFDRTCAFMGIDPAGVELVFYQPTHRPGFARSLVRSHLGWAGQFKLREGSNVVEVNVTYLPLPESLLAVFAHELSHQILLGSKRICAEDQDHELVTDLATVFFGLGIFNANESFTDHFRVNRRGDEILRTGYLTPRIWGYALALCAWLRNEKKPAWAGWLRPAIRKTFRRSLTYLLRTGDAQVVEGGQLDDAGRVSLLKIEYPELARADTISTEPADPQNGELNEDRNARTDLKVATDFDTRGAESAELFYEASQYVEAGEWCKAKECLSKVICLEPDNGTAYQERALVHLELRMFDDALHDAEAAVRLEPNDSDSYLARGAAYVEVRQFENAIADLTQYINDEDFLAASGGHASRGYYLRGLAFAGLGNLQKAIKDYDRAIHRWPDWPEPYEARAEAYESLGNSKLARADQDEARRRATP
jgi:tetratricopeptide (TPR) repeat protein